MKKSFSKLIMSAVLVCGFVMSTATTAFAANFTPSVEDKGAPEIIVSEDEKGNEVVAIIRDEKDEEVVGVPTGELIVTSVAKAKEATEEIKGKLEYAKKQIQDASSIKDLVPEVEGVLKEIKSDAKVENLTVRDLFDVTLTGTYEEELKKEGNTVTVKFDLKLKPDATLMVLHNISGDNWEIIPNDRVVRHTDGSVSVTFDSLSPVAFVVDKTETDTQLDANAPQTGEKMPIALYVGAGVLGVAAITFFCLAHNKKKQHTGK